MDVEHARVSDLEKVCFTTEMISNGSAKLVLNGFEQQLYRVLRVAPKK